MTVYTDPDYKGASAELGPGRHKLAPEMTDAISSVRVPSGYTVTLYDNADFTGEKVKLTADTASVTDVLDNKASAIEVKGDGTTQAPSVPISKLTTGTDRGVTNAVDSVYVLEFLYKNRG
ncbi:peptidase inhibitor family I36 protein [Streptomyces achromogenes]|uniref:peptidase inhibitor family I36 protein n=1 Tax=Streptomyces achromogenes TaxID=67255 RepID=UPI0033D5DFA9